MTSYVVPDSIEPVIGWKNLFLKEGFLYSPTYKMIWRPKRPACATCQRPDGPVARRHGGEWISPAQHCTCGIYMVKDMQYVFGYLVTEMSGHYNVISKVAGWGKVIPGTAGYRVQSAYPQELLLLSQRDKVPARELNKLVAALEKSYGVPARLLTSADIVSAGGFLPRKSDPRATGGVPWAYYSRGIAAGNVRTSGMTSGVVVSSLDPESQPRRKQRVWHLAAFAAINAGSAVLNASLWYFGSRSIISLVVMALSAATAVTLGLLVKRIRKANNG